MGTKEIFLKQGGVKLLKQYWHGGSFFTAACECILLGKSRKALEILRLSASFKTVERLRRLYRKEILTFQKNYVEKKSCTSNKVWICWLQGMEKAPELVQKCYQSVCENIPDREIVLLTENNYRDYVQFPDFIQKKIEDGIISRTHMSDLLRLELLIRYGGTWIDATVFCSGPVPAYMVDSDLFLFQNLKPGLDGHCTSISSWFMTACTNHPILLLTRELLYAYWKKNDFMVDYFLLHDFFQLAIEAYPEKWKKVIPFSNSTPHILLLRLFETYDENIWSGVKSQTSIHKLSYKFPEEKTELKNTYYSAILT